MFADCVNWENLAEYDEESRKETLPVRGKVPNVLQIRFPDLDRGGEKVQPTCRDFISGLLYVRIPKRLGVGDNFRPFCDHDWFIDQNIDFYGGTVFLVQL
jgi:hypothetical protein